MNGKIAVHKLKEQSKNEYYFTNLDGEKTKKLKVVLKPMVYVIL